VRLRDVLKQILTLRAPAGCGIVATGGYFRCNNLDVHPGAPLHLRSAEEPNLDYYHSSQKNVRYYLDRWHQAHTHTIRQLGFRINTRYYRCLNTRPPLTAYAMLTGRPPAVVLLVFKTTNARA
jgi:hypothetical protein